MNRLRHPIPAGILGLLLAVVVLVQLVSPSSEQARMTTFAQWLDRSLPGETSSPWANPEQSDRMETIQQLQRWLTSLELDAAIEDETPIGTNGEPIPLSWPAPGWILQAWSDYNEMSGGMQTTLPDRPTTSGKWILQEVLPDLSIQQAGTETVRLVHYIHGTGTHLLPYLRRPFLSGLSINAP
ncbi:MAG: hypothetical protein WEA36_05700 [Balneolaceae bacterium]